MKLLKIKSIEKEQYNGKIYDLEIENSHTYNIENIIVGNCSGGLHGVGTKCTNALSDDFEVWVKRYGNVYNQRFSKGKPLTEVNIIDSCDKEDTGTIIRYHPDKEIFKHTLEPSDTAVQNRLEELASLNSGVVINYNNKIAKVEKQFYSETGLKSYVKKLAADKPLLFEEPLHCTGKYTLDNGKDIVAEIALIYDDDIHPHETFRSFANNINTYEGGYHLQGFRDSFKNCMNNFICKNNLYKDNIELRYMLDGIYCVISIKIPDAQFEGQTKTQLGNEEAKTAVGLILEAAFEQFAKKRKSDLMNIANRAIKTKDAEEAARKARAASRKANKVANAALPGKLSDCSNKNGYTEIFIVEGDSAGGAVKQGRDRRFQAVLPLRGKVLNIEKSTFDKMMNSEAIKNIIASIGTGIGDKYNDKKRRYDKIIIMTDADDDGCHIRTLILTLMFRYMRPLLENGMVYASIPPLYRVNVKNKSYYITNDLKLKEFKKKYPNIDNNSVQRFKGLGEMNWQQLKETVLNPENRTLKRISIKDAEEANEMFEILMGNSVPRRREFIENNANDIDENFM